MKIKKIRKHILQIYTDYDNSLGAYKIRRVLERDYGIKVSLGRVYRLINNMNLPKRSTEKPKKKAGWKDNGLCINHLKQQFNPNTPNSVWASDFTYIKVNGSFHYLCVIIDLFSRKVVGWSLSHRHNVDFIIEAFNKAYSNRGEPHFLLFHSDQGAEYTSLIFRQTLERCDAVQSFSKKGYPYDNACCESFFHHMKRECINRKSFRNKE
ncbi:TPA: IS3 family transposase, partial [Streptococcus suis]